MIRSYLASQKSVLAVRPLVVGCFVNSASLLPQQKNASSNMVDLIEVRLDSFPLQDLSVRLIKNIRKKSKKPLLLTFRAGDEQGASRSSRFSISDRRRAAVIASLLPFVRMIDVEIRHAAFARELTRLAHRSRVDVIHSLHDYLSATRFSFYQKYADLSRRMGGDIFKIAVNPKNTDQLERFLAWGGELKNPRKVLIGMGPAGRVSRVLGYTFGSILAYGHLGKSAAPGQMAAAEVGKSIRRIYGL